MIQRPADSTDLAVLADLAPELATTFVSVASDIALVIGPDGVIRNVAQGDEPLVRQADQWVGQPFVDAVSAETRGKIQQLLQDVDARGVSPRREVILPGAQGAEIPVAFSAIRLGRDGPVLAVGRDLRAIAAIQQRFVEAQQELERDYWRQRQAETRYRQLFHVATDAVLVVDAATLAIAEANLAAAALFGRPAEQLAGTLAAAGFGPASRPAVEALLSTARTTGKPSEIRARLSMALPGEEAPLVDLSATPFRAAGESGARLLLLVRARRALPGVADDRRRLADYVENTPDAVVVTDSSGRVLSANMALLRLCLPGTDPMRLRGRPLVQLLGDPGHQLEALLLQARRQGVVPQATLQLGGHGSQPLLQIEASATLLDEGDQECIGFTLRRLAQLPTALPPVNGLAEAIEGLVGQLGRVSLPELMQEATHLAERHLIRQALGRAQGDAAIAADWLGITADSLALRMHRHGLFADGAGLAPPPGLLN